MLDKGRVALILLFAIFPESAETHMEPCFFFGDMEPSFIFLSDFHFSRQAKHTLDLLSENHHLWVTFVRFQQNFNQRFASVEEKDVNQKKKTVFLEVTLFFIRC